MNTFADIGEVVRFAIVIPITVACTPAPAVKIVVFADTFLPK
jgi:hypothetical protein